MLNFLIQYLTYYIWTFLRKDPYWDDDYRDPDYPFKAYLKRQYRVNSGVT